MTGGVLLIALWIVLALREYPPAWDQWLHELSRVKGDVGRGDEDREDPLLAYTWMLPQSTLPWCAFAVFGVATAWKRRRRPANVVLASWGVVGFLLVSASAFKVLHYILPAVAPVLMLAAVGFDACWPDSSRPSRSNGGGSGNGRRWRAGSAGWRCSGWSGRRCSCRRRDWGRKVPRVRAVRADARPAGPDDLLLSPGPADGRRPGGLVSRPPAAPDRGRSRRAAGVRDLRPCRGREIRANPRRDRASGRRG